MDMKQESIIKIYNADKKIVVYCDNDVSLGSLHDFLLELKGNIIERMKKVQTEETAPKPGKAKQEEAIPAEIPKK